MSALDAIMSALDTIMSALDAIMGALDTIMGDSAKERKKKLPLPQPSQRPPYHRSSTKQEPNKKILN